MSILFIGFVMVRVFSAAFGGTKGMEKMLKGTVTRELGVIETRSKGWTTITTTAYEMTKNGERVLVLRKEAKAPLGFSVQFHEYPPAVRAQLRAAIEAMDGPPAGTVDGSVFGVISG